MPTHKKSRTDQLAVVSRKGLHVDRHERQVDATVVAVEDDTHVSIPVSLGMSRPAADRLRAFMTHGQNRFVVSSSDGALSVRISMVIARSSATQEVIAHLGNAAIDWDRGTISREGRSATLSRTELRLLACLVEHAGRIVAHDHLISSAWGMKPDDAGYNVLAVYVCYLRRSLKSIGLGQALRTARGFGYALGDPPKTDMDAAPKVRRELRHVRPNPPHLPAPD